MVSLLCKGLQLHTDIFSSWFMSLRSATCLSGWVVDIAWLDQKSERLDLKFVSYQSIRFDGYCTMHKYCWRGAIFWPFCWSFGVHTANFNRPKFHLRFQYSKTKFLITNMFEFCWKICKWQLNYVNLQKWPGFAAIWLSTSSDDFGVHCCLTIKVENHSHCWQRTSNSHILSVA